MNLYACGGCYDGYAHLLFTVYGFKQTSYLSTNIPFVGALYVKD